MNYKQITYVVLISALIITILLIIFFDFPGTNSSNTEFSITTINYVSHISDTHQKVIDKFNDKYKGRIKVESINLPFEKFSTNERKELLARYLRSKSDRIDVFTVDQIWVSRFAKWVIRFERFFKQEERNKLLDYGMKTCFFNDSLVAIPLYIDIAVMFYRDDLLSNFSGYNKLKQSISKSISWEDLIKIRSNTVKKPNPFFLFPADNYEGLMCVFIEMMESQGRSLIEDDKLQLTSIEAVRSLELMVDFVNKYDITPKEVVNSRESEIYNSFLNNNGLFLIGWPAFLYEHPKFTIDKGLVNHIKIAPIPHFEDGKSVSTFGGWNLMVSKFSQNVDEAIVFIKYLISEEAQSILYEEGGYLPINNSIYEYEENEKLLFYKQLMKTGVHRPFLENYTKISDIIVEYLNKAIKKELSVELALKGAEKKIMNENIFIK